MEFMATQIPDVVLIKPKVFGDERGYFMETWEKHKFAQAGINAEFVQDNYSRSVQATLRGLHYQIEQPQGKLVRVTVGEVFDIAVDIRKRSPTFTQWIGVVLSAQNKHQLWVPPGFAHGFVVLSETAEFSYKCTDFYAPQHERSIIWNDPDIGIDWPIPHDQPPILSPKDRAGVPFKAAELYP
jgi:dTDP-4-dehydrorhamnose 3,5-epimerase